MSKIPTVIVSNSSRKAHAAPAEASVLRWLDYLPAAPLAVSAALLAVAPPFAEPHLWQALRRFAAGEAFQAVHVLDLFFHTGLLVLLALKLLRLRQLLQPRNS